MASLISSIHSNLGLNGLDTYVPDLSDSANIRDALELFYYGNLGTTAETFSIYNHLNNSSLHISASANIHGIGAGNAVVGTGTSQTLTNKTLTNPTINAATLSGTITGNFTTLGTITNSGTISGGKVNATTYEQSNVEGFLIPVGVIVPYSGSVSPTGWLLCHGQSTNATAHPKLWQVIGTLHGGSGSASFNVPDLRGRVIAGVDNMGGSDAGRISITNTWGATGGNESVVVPVPYHAHNVTFRRRLQSSETHDHEGWAAGDFSAPPDNRDPGAESTQDVTNTTDYQGTNGVTMNVTQPTMVLNYIIKAA